MGFESRFTIYRKYDVRMTEEEKSKVVNKYLKELKDNDYSEYGTSDEEYMKMIPLILDPNYMGHGDVYNHETKEWEDRSDHSIEGQRRNFNYALSSDGSHLDEMLSWSFGSDFTCICNEYRMGCGKHGNEILIDVRTAEKILQACAYLLSGKWSDDIEDILDNRWISILASGNDGNSYWQYVYRKNRKMLKDVLEGEEETGTRNVLMRLKNVMETFLRAEDGKYDKDRREYILVYSISC